MEWLDLTKIQNIFHLSTHLPKKCTESLSPPCPLLITGMQATGCRCIRWIRSGRSLFTRHAEPVGIDPTGIAFHIRFFCHEADLGADPLAFLHFELGSG